MTAWIFFLVVLAILSYLTDIGVTRFMLNLKAPGLGASLLSVLILLCAAGLLARMLWMRRKAVREHLRERIQALEGELRQLKDRA